MMRKTLVVASFLTATIASPALALPLTNGTGDGTVSLDVTATGYFSSAYYNPVGAIGSADTTASSDVAFRIGSGQVNWLSTANATVTGSTGQSVTSSFTFGGVVFTLVQTVGDLLTNNVRSGALLTQTYTLQNMTGGDIDLQLTRYIDGDLSFDGSISDGGGRSQSNGRQILFETDSATGANDSTTFLGIFNEGGIAGGYDIDHYSTLRGRIGSGQDPRNQITNDLDSNGFVDAGHGYDLALGLRNLFSLSAGGTATFTTSTIFGGGSPGAIQLPPTGVPEPAALGLLGLGILGIAGARRRKA